MTRRWSRPTASILTDISCSKARTPALGNRLFREIRSLGAYQCGNDAEVVGDPMIGLRGDIVGQNPSLGVFGDLGEQSKRHVLTGHV